jgi:ubiquinone/menaquinone biosynthesis C-methylase UbiE
MRDPYAHLAPVYDAMAADPGIKVFYRRWRDSLLTAARERGIRGRILVDLACGTGNSTIPWAHRPGWTVIGVDRSAAMLRVARAKSKAVRWVRQDITGLALDVEADFVTCHFDALNHVLDERNLRRVFRHVAAVLRPGGLFQFDLNTVHMLRWLSDREKLLHAGPHWFTAFNAYDSKTGVATFNQMWFIRRGRQFERCLVTVHERAFADAAIRRMLDDAGLRLLKIEPQVAIDGKPMRKLFLAQRAARSPGHPKPARRRPIVRRPSSSRKERS